MSEILSRNQERNKETQTSNPQGLIAKIAKTALSVAVANKVMNKTKLKDSNLKSLIAFGAGIALNSMNDENENDVASTIIAAGALYGSGKIAKKVIKENGEAITKTIFKLNEKNKNFREVILDYGQKKKEIKSGITKFDSYEKQYEYLWDTKQKSKAFELYKDKNSNANAFVNYNNAQKTFIDPVIGQYFNKRNQIEKRGGFGFFDQTIKNLKLEDGKIVFNEKKILASRTDFDVANTFLNHFSKQLMSYSKDNDNVSMNEFIDYLKRDSNNKDQIKLINDFKDHFHNISKGDKVNLGDLFEQDSIKKEILNKTQSLSFLNTYTKDKDGKTILNNEKLLSMFKDINVKDLDRDSNGTIFDSSILDVENIFLDTMQMLDKSIRPPFAILPGEKQNFSLVPFDVKARILDKNSSDFKIIQTNIDYDRTIANLEETKKSIKQGSLKGIAKEDLRNQREDLLREIDEKINYFEYEKDFIGRTNPANSEFKKTAINMTFGYDANNHGKILINERKEKDIKAYVSNEVLNYVDNKNNWNTKEGKYGFTYSKMFKDNETAKYNASIAKEFGEYGQFEQSLNQDHMFGMIQKKYNNWRDKDNSQFISELNNDFEKIKKTRDDMIEELRKKNYSDLDSEVFTNRLYNNTKDINFDGAEELKKLVTAEKAYIYKSNLGVNSIFNSNLGKDDYLKDIKNADATIKEQFIKNLMNTDILKDKNLDILQGERFNTNHLKDKYYKSLIPSKRGTLYKKSEGIKDWFSTSKDEVGTLENAYMNNFFNKFEDSLNFIGIKKLNPGENYSTGQHAVNVMTKRVLPFLAAIGTMKAIDGLTDVLTPDDGPLGNGGISGMAAKTYATMRIGMQVLAENTGIKDLTQYFIDQGLGFLDVTGLNMSTEEMYQQYFEGKLAPIKRNRFWFSSGRNGFEGGEIKEYRQHLLYKMQNRDSGIYKNKAERFYREDFFVTKYASRLLDPYLEERRLFEKGLPLDKSEQLFRDIPIFGELLSATIGQIIKPTVYYTEDRNEFSAPLRIVNNAFEDIKAFGGLQGYGLSKFTDFMFGGKSIKDIALNHGFETRELASVDAITGLGPSYDRLELGGMFGLTEPIRRLIPNNNKERKSTMENKMPLWFSEQNRKNNLELLNPNYLTPERYEQLYGKNPDDKFNDFGLIDRLKILASTNPNSTKFYDYKNMAINNINKGKYNSSQIEDIYNSISISENLNHYNETKKSKYVAGAKFQETQIQIDNVISHNEVIANGKRIKFAGISDNFNFASNKIGTKQAMNEINSIKNFLNNSKSLNVTINQDMLKNVKSDSKGQYIEVFSDQLYNSTKIKKDTYFNQKNKSFIGNKINQGFEGIVSQTFDVTKNKFFSNKTAVEEWEDSLTIPEFRDWDSPIDSFIKPLGDLAAGDLSQNFLAYDTLKNNSLTKDISASSSLATGYLLGNKLFGSGNSYYKSQSDLNKKYQEILYQNKMVNSLEANEDYTNTELTKTLNKSDAKYFYHLINEVDDTKINKIKTQGNEELNRAMKIIENKKVNYLYGTNQRVEQNQLPERTAPDYEYQYDYFYNIAKIKQSQNMSLSSLEKRKLNNMYYKNEDENMKISEEELRRRIYRNRKSTVTSTIYNNKNSYLY
ncbi:MAG: hypothetical protein ACRCW9_03195 [Cetobacterium sp.]